MELMNKVGRLTFFFEDIFPSYNEWLALMGDIINQEDPIEVEVNKLCYEILFAHFLHANVRYTTREDFKIAIKLVFRQKFNQFVTEKKLIDKLQNLTDDELLLVGESISNMAYNPNTKTIDPKQALDYISDQNYSIQRTNKFNAYLNALKNIPSLNIFKFINERGEFDGMNFTDLFMAVSPHTEYLYDK